MYKNHIRNKIISSLLCFIFVFVIFSQTSQDDRTSIIGDTQYDDICDDIFKFREVKTSFLPVWNLTWGGTSDEDGKAICFDSEGNFIVVGDIVEDPGVDEDIFIRKYYNNGTLIWSELFNTTVESQAMDVAVDSSDHIYIAGQLSMGALVEQTLLIRYNKTGNYAWNKTWGGNYFDIGNGVDVDSNDNIYLIGYRDEGGLNPLTLIWLQYHSNGSLLNGFYDSGYDAGMGIAIDDNDNVYVAGADFNLLSGPLNIQLIKYDTSGNDQWARLDRDGSDTYGFRITTDNKNDVIFIGIDDGNWRLLKYNASGDQYWGENFCSGQTNMRNDLAVDKDNNIYVLEDNGATIDYLIKYNSSGDLQWKHYLDGAVDNRRFLGIDIDNSSNIIVVGSNSTPSNGRDLLIMKFNNKPEYFTIQSNATSPETDGVFYINWTESTESNNYSVYYSNQSISEINENVTLYSDGITDLNYTISSLKNGIYYFVVVACNDFGETISSNELYVDIEVFPGSFNLSSDAEPLDNDGTFNLTWTVSNGANNYSIYKCNKSITDHNGTVIKIASNLIELNYTINNYSSGDYYFQVMALNELGNATSNNVFVQVRIPPKNFTLSSNVTNPDSDGLFLLNWTESVGADNYSVYYSRNYIVEINSSSICFRNNVTDLSIVTEGFFKGDFYFIVRAFNETGFTDSNCLNISIEINASTIMFESESGNVITSTSFILSWNPLPGTNNYTLLYDTSIIFSTGMIFASNITQTSIEITGLTDGEYYFVLVAYSQFDNLTSDNMLIRVQIQSGNGGNEPESMWPLIILLISIIAAVSIGGFTLVRRSRKQVREKDEEIKTLREQREEITEDDIILSKEKHLCLVHKGPIQGYSFICPTCGAYYCANCIEALKEIENICWSCEKPLDPSKPIIGKEEDDIEAIIEEETHEEETHEEVSIHKRGIKKNTNNEE
jgi:ribosomal protein S6